MSTASPDGVPGGFSIYRGSSTAIVAYATAEVIISMPRCKARTWRGGVAAVLLGAKLGGSRAVLPVFYGRADKKALPRLSFNYLSQFNKKQRRA